MCATENLKITDRLYLFKTLHCFKLQINLFMLNCRSFKAVTFKYLNSAYFLATYTSAVPTYMFGIMCRSVVLILACLVNGLAANGSKESRRPPHIVIILADDMGWNDVGFHGSAQIPTPNMDALAYCGVQLHAHYAPPLCTPARAALLTGKYPIHTGLQHSVILAPEPRGLNLNIRLLPELLQERGYRTHIVGKWHLGFHHAAYTPTRRGFHSHFGYWNGFQDYYEHTVEATFNRSMYGVDMRRNLTLSLESQGQYATHLYTEEAVSLIRRHPLQDPLFLYLSHLAPHTGTRRRPMQPPPQPNNYTAAIADTNRRDYAAMTAELDTGVGAVVEALRARNMLQDTIILLLSDNGAPTRPQVHGNSGSNYPLRGEKNTPWEGGARTVGVLWTARLAAAPRLHTQPLHITDWMPTLYRAAGGDPKTLKGIDGVDAWDAIHRGRQSRQELLINIDLPPNATVPQYWSMRRDRWKLVWVQKKSAGDEWLGDSGASFIYRWNDTLESPAAKALAKIGFGLNLTTAQKLRQQATVRCPPPHHDPPSCVEAPCLFDLESDPCETLDVAKLRKALVESIHSRVKEWITGIVPAENLPGDPRADPVLHGGAWSCWGDEVEDPDGIFMKSKRNEDHWEYVVAAAGCLAVFMLVCGGYAGWMRRRPEEGAGVSCCGIGGRVPRSGRAGGSLVALRVQIFEDLAREPGSRVVSFNSANGLKVT